MQNSGFFTDIYDSWKRAQNEKYEGIYNILGPDFFKKMKGNAIDIGAGSGFFEDFLEGKGISIDVICLEPDRKIIRRKKNFVLGSAEAEEMPFIDGIFDFAFCFDALHLIKKMPNPLKKGDILVASMFYNEDNFNEKRDIIIGKIKDYSIIKEFLVDGIEKEIVIIARKE